MKYINYFLFLFIVVSILLIGCDKEDPSIEEPEEEIEEEEIEEEVDISVMTYYAIQEDISTGVVVAAIKDYEEYGIQEVGIVYSIETDTTLFEDTLKNPMVEDEFTIYIPDLAINTNYSVKAYAKSKDEIYLGNTVTLRMKEIEAKEYLPTRWTKDGRTLGTIAYKYFEPENISEVKTYFDYELDHWSSRLKFTSHGPNGPTSSQIDADGWSTTNSDYYYVEGKLDSVFNNAQGEKTSQKFYHNEGFNCSIDSMVYYEEGDFLYEAKFENFDENCSVNVQNYHNYYDYIFTYDDKKGFFHYRDYTERNIFELIVLPTVHNIIKLEVVNRNTGETYLIFNSTYEYDNDGYPKKEKRTYNSGNVEEYTFHYKTK